MSTRIKVHVRLKSNGKEIKLNAIKFKKLKTEELLKNKAFNEGFFHAKVSSETKIKKRKLIKKN